MSALADILLGLALIFSAPLLALLVLILRVRFMRFLLARKDI